MKEQWFFFLGIKRAKSWKRTAMVAQLIYKTTSSPFKAHFYGDLHKKSGIKVTIPQDPQKYFLQLNLKA